MSTPRVTLVGDDIENPANRQTLARVAKMFGVDYRAYSAVAADATASSSLPAAPQPISAQGLTELHARIIAFDNRPGASDVYGFRPGRDFAVLVGNERRGLSAGCRALATSSVQVPMISRSINCLNVGAAAAVALYYMCRSPAGGMAARRDPASRRPELLLLGAADHVELGSTIRSAAAFGWERLWLDDHAGVWFGVDRSRIAEGRAAARQARNEIRIRPCPRGARFDFPRVAVLNRERRGRPIHRVDLARGPAQLIVLSDHGQIAIDHVDWGQYGREIEFAYLDLPAPEAPYQYRLDATIAMAEVSRQVGRRKSVLHVRGQRGDGFEFAARLDVQGPGECIALSELLAY